MGVGEGVGFAGGGQGEEIGLERRDAVEAPGGVGQGLDEVGLDGAFGAQVVGERGAVGTVGLQIFGRHDDDLAGEAVAEGVQ